MKIICKICDKECKSVMSLVIHLRNIHKFKPIKYYDKYLKKEDEEICPICENETTFRSISYGYYKYCSKKCSYKSNDVKEKRKNTNLEKYGCENTGQNTEIKEKIKKTNIEKYGGIGFQVKELANKSRNTHYEKYGCYFPIQNEETRKKISQSNLIKTIPKLNNILKYLKLELISEYIGKDNNIKVKCKECNSIFETQYGYLNKGYGKCSICFPIYKSNNEIELAEFINSLNLEILSNKRDIIDPYELDIFIPDKNIAIEFDGLYWHSEKNGKDKNYHLNKTELCEKKNIQLIHIFEDEWILKQEIVKSRIKQILGLNNNLPKIHDRKCIIKEIDPTTKNLFLNEFHIQGEDRSSVKLGAFNNGVLISVMTFSHGNISKGSKNIENIYELNRFCSNSNYQVPGIASKLLEFFKRNYEWKEIYSYADRRWSDVNLYIKIGFELDSITKPNYWYIKNQNRTHRFNLRKRPDEPKDIPEWVLRSKEGYNRIWDCGHYKFIMKKENKKCINLKLNI